MDDIDIRTSEKTKLRFYYILLYSEISILLSLDFIDNLVFIDNLGFIECPLQPTENKRSRFY